MDFKFSTKFFANKNTKHCGWKYSKEAVLPLPACCTRVKENVNNLPQEQLNV